MYVTCIALTVITRKSTVPETRNSNPHKTSNHGIVTGHNTVIAVFIFRAILIVLNGVIQRFFLGLVFFFLLSVAERTFKQVYLNSYFRCIFT